MLRVVVSESVASEPGTFTSTAAAAARPSSQVFRVKSLPFLFLDFDLDLLDVVVVLVLRAVSYQNHDPSAEL